jgi:hypothetical protein
MSTEIRNLEPKALWNNFADLNDVPRPSKQEERVIAFAKAFGEKLGLPTRVDEVGNVIITKPATPGMEDRAKIVVQGHLDMVHQKNADTDFDFNTQGIDMFIEGDWVKARGTTLGADNGMGVAAAMTLLASDDIPHPAMEALFTIDEETGMTGAQGLKAGELEGTVEEIGFRSTRIRTFAKTLITVPNNVIANMPIDNFSQMPKRRIKLTIGVTYDTSSDQMRQAVEKIRELLKTHPAIDQEFFLVNFTDFGASSLDIMVYCFTKTTVWGEYLDARQDVSLKIMDTLEGMGLDIAFPSQTLYLQNPEEASE